jgi:hypothetical protein
LDEDRQKGQREGREGKGRVENAREGKSQDNISEFLS